tara:strand:+ start:477 stop:578 length:102 start_codon:yes stop_codon:yes gene_type:complete
VIAPAITDAVLLIHHLLPTAEAMVIENLPMLFA